MSESVEAKPNFVRDFVSLIDRIFISAVLGQVFLILFIFFVGLSVYVWHSSAETAKKIDSNYREWEAQLTEAIYVNGITRAFSEEQLPVVRDFQNALRINGIRADVSVGACGHLSPDQKQYFLQVGEFRLRDCVKITQRDNFALQGILFGFGLALISLVMTGMGWFFWRGRLKLRVVNPMIESLEREVRDAATGKMASQLAHDIRSPLSALTIFMKDAGDLSEERRLLLRSAVTRIQDIANNILPKKKSAVDVAQKRELRLRPELITTHLETLISEKRLQYRELLGCEIELQLGAGAYGAFTQIDVSEFQRMISNLIDNSVEAMPGHRGRVVISVESGPEIIKLRVTDTGKGIPSEIIPKLMQVGASFNKVGGSGLGLAHARDTMHKLGGAIEVVPRAKGAEVVLQFRREKSPDWFFESISLKGPTKVVIIDDDASIHQIWTGRFLSARAHEFAVELIHFSKPRESESFLRDQDPDSIGLLLVDYEFLGDELTGLDWIVASPFAKRCVLVTSRFDEVRIRTRCEDQGIKLLPKPLSAYIPINIVEIGVQKSSTAATGL